MPERVERFELTVGNLTEFFMVHLQQALGITLGLKFDSQWGKTICYLRKAHPDSCGMCLSNSVCSDLLLCIHLIGCIAVADIQIGHCLNQLLHAKEDIPIDQDSKLRTVRI